MEIVIVAGGMPFGPETLRRKSLGGSETAVINVAKHLRHLGHLITVFCPLDQPPGMDEDGIRWVPIDQYQAFISNTEVDALIISRQPELAQINHQAKKAILWNHDLATFNYTVPGIQAIGWNVDEVWTVSEYHRQQWHKVTGFPLDHIWATRNGITNVETMEMGKVDKQLLYAARPERGLENLVKPGGIMSRLKEYTLKVTMYDNYPQQLMPYYNQLWDWAKQLPNVEILPPQTQQQLRQLMRNSFAYVYPTDFEEVSCIIARECIEQKLPMVCTAKGALLETLGSCGVFVPASDVGGDEYIDRFCREVRALEETAWMYVKQMEKRTDLSWADVAVDWVNRLSIPQRVTNFSMAWSLIEDSDVIPAVTYMTKHMPDHWLLEQVKTLYPYLFGNESFEDYYERYFKIEDKKGARKHPRMEGNPRFEAIASHVAKLPAGAIVLDYGCAEGVIVLGLAERFKDKMFYAIDFAASNIELCKQYRQERGLTNVTFHHGSMDNWPEESIPKADAIICSEVLEHVSDPWQLVEFLELKANKDGRFILTVPTGAWEAIGLYNKDQWPWRAHIWHINKTMLRIMFADKKNCQMSNLSNGHTPDGRGLGHLVFAYDIDYEPVHPMDPYAKALQHRSRQTIGAAMIAMNSEATILNTLNSLDGKVQQISIALGPSNDATKLLVHNWQSNHPWVHLVIVDVPKIEAGLFGFDDARNASIAPLETDWVLWIDTDEYLSGDPRKYARVNAFDSYAIHQHHFTCDPRGAPTQLDKPARMFRRNDGFKFYGKVHEHAEKGYNGGPGFCMILGDVDIGHPGYVNEDVRRARFIRNFPLLEWDRKVFPERKLGHYLWLRDIIHRMRYFSEQRNIQEARRLAEEALTFYKRTWKEYDAAGMGGVNALGYYSEALAFLGRGIGIQIAMKIPNSDPKLEVNAAISGVFESAEEAAEVIRVALRSEFDKRKSGYAQ